MSRKSAFTLIELVVVMVIIGILAVISVPMYNGYIQRAVQSEGRVLVGSVANAERVYYIEHEEFWPVGPGTRIDETMGVDARTNTYFGTFEVQVPNPESQVFTAFANGTHPDAPWNIRYDGNMDAPPIVSIEDQ